MITSRSTHDAANGVITFSFLRLSSIPMYVCVCVCVCVYMYIYVYIYTHHIIFIHLSVGEHLGCIHVLAIVNSAIMNTGVQISFQVVFSRYMPRSGIAGSYSSSFFFF